MKALVIFIISFFSILTGYSNCSVPFNLTTTNVTSVGVNFGLEISTTNLKWVEIRYRILGGSWYSSGQLAPAASYNVRRNNLSPNRTYQWSVIATCQDLSKITLGGSQFTTPLVPYCQTPDSLWITDIYNTGVSFNWKTKSNVSRYQIWGKTVASSTWKLLGNVSGDKTTFRYGEFVPNTSYNWYIVSFCNNGDFPNKRVVGPAFTTSDIAFCTNVYNPVVLDISPTAVTFGWEHLGDTINYQELEVSNSIEGIVDILWIKAYQGTQITLSGLVPNTTYTWKIKTHCTNRDRQAWVIGDPVTTLCESPIPLTVSPITKSGTTATATFNWTKGTGVSHYNIQYKRSTSGTWLSINSIDSSNSSFTKSGLALNQTWNWRIQSVCLSDETNDWVNGPNFSTIGLAARMSTWINSLQVYPNPSEGTITLSQETSQKVYYEVKDALNSISHSGYITTQPHNITLEKGIWYLQITDGIISETQILSIY
jgi:hypothetical protein